MPSNKWGIDKDGSRGLGIPEQDHKAPYKG